MSVIPAAFSTEHKSMLEHYKMISEDGRVIMHPCFDKLITALRTAVGLNFIVKIGNSIHFEFERMITGKYLDVDSEYY
jgi:hypothetical protein